MMRVTFALREPKAPQVNVMRLTDCTPPRMSRFDVWRHLLRQHWRIALLALLPIAALVVAATSNPVAQDLGYHRFADTRVVLGVPNFANVVSNVPFLIVGIAGFALCWR